MTQRDALRNQQGMAAVWTLLVTAGTFTLLLGLVVDGGNAIDARLEAKRAAEQAARAGADELAEAAIRSGRDASDTSRAQIQARRILEQSGWRGSVRVSGNQVTVTARGSSATTSLGVLGVRSLPVHEAGTAEAITGDGLGRP